MAGFFARLLTAHTVTVEPYLGQNGRGKDTFGPAVNVTGWLEESTRNVIGADGDEVTTAARFYTAVANAASFPLKSRVTTQVRTARVILANSNTSGSLRLPDHLVVDLL